tara:strand:- start:68 stop:1342 length:1275 start_codon:yes stop_codon:yes gene_type:complete
MTSLKVYLFAVFTLALFGMGNTIADNGTESDEISDLEYQNFFMRSDMTLSKDLENSSYQQTVEAQYDVAGGGMFKTNRQPVYVGEWTSFPMDYNLNFTVEDFSILWQSNESGDDSCEWLIRIRVNGENVDEEYSDCQHSGSTLKEGQHQLSFELHLNQSHNFSVELWYEGWEDITIFYDEVTSGNATDSSNLRISCMYSCDPIPMAKIESISHLEAEKGVNIEFNGTGFLDYGVITNYNWTSVIDGKLSNLSNFSTSGLSLGHHFIFFSVSSDLGTSELVSSSIWIYAKPVALAGVNITGTPGVPIQFSGAGTDEDGTIINYQWDFDGDGIFEWTSGENGLDIYIYNTAGNYTASFKVTDNDGFSNVDSISISITEKKVVITEDDEGNVTVTVDETEDSEESVPSISIISIVALVGLLVILRRK